MIVFWTLVSASLVLMLLANFDGRLLVPGGVLEALLGFWMVYQGLVSEPWMGFTVAGLGTTIAVGSSMVVIVEMRRAARIRIERRWREQSAPER